VNAAAAPRFNIRIK